MTDNNIIVPVDLKNEKPNGCLLVVTYYGFKKPICNACQAFANKTKWIVVEFPMFRYRNDVHDKTESYIDMFCDTVKKYSPDSILFWYHFLTAQEMELIQHTVNKKIPFLLFNWDDPFSWHDKHGHIAEIAKYFDGVLTSSRKCVELYRNEISQNAKRREQFPNPVVRYCLPGFDEKLSESKLLQFGNDNFVCDVLFMTTNLYEDEQRYNRQRVNRAKIVDALYARHVEKNIVFHIYGPEFLAKRYPQSYQGYCDYDKQYEVNHTARLVLSTHVVCEEGYCNERVCVALGCGALIISDIPNADIYQKTQKDVTETVCVYDLGDTLQNALQTIVELLKKPAAEYLAVRNQNRKIAKQHLSWEVWADILHETLNSLSIAGNADNAAKVAKSLIVGTNLIPEASVANSSTGLMTGESDKKEFVQSLNYDEKELVAELETTICARDKSPMPTLVVPYKRQYQLSSLITSIRNQSDINTGDLKKLVDIIDANPDLDINGVLEFHWCHIDK